VPYTVSEGAGDTGQGGLELVKEVVEGIPGSTFEGDGVGRGGAAGRPLSTPDIERGGGCSHHAGATAPGDTDASELEATGGEGTRRATDAGRNAGRGAGRGVRRVVKVVAGTSSGVSGDEGRSRAAGQRRKVSGAGVRHGAGQGT